MDTGILITGIIGLVTTIVSAWTSWFFARKKYNTEVDHNLIENMRESLEFYKQLSDDNKMRLEESIKRCNILEEELVLVNTEITTLRKQILDLTFNICMDLTCKRRQGDLHVKTNKTSGPEATLTKN